MAPNAPDAPQQFSAITRQANAASETLYVLDGATKTITTYPMGQQTPASTFTVAEDAPLAIDTDAKGNLYVLSIKYDDSANRIGVYSPGATTPFKTIALPRYIRGGSIGVAPDGTIYTVVGSGWVSKIIEFVHGQGNALTIVPPIIASPFGIGPVTVSKSNAAFTFLIGGACCGSLGVRYAEGQKHFGRVPGTAGLTGPAAIDAQQNLVGYVFPNAQTGQGAEVRVVGPQGRWLSLFAAPAFPDAAVPEMAYDEQQNVLLFGLGQSVYVMDYASHAHLYDLAGYTSISGIAIGPHRYYTHF